MKFATASDVASVVQTMVDNNLARSRNRALINQLFNGSPPYSDAEAEAHNLFTNVNFLEAANKAHDVRSQFFNALMGNSEYYSVTLTEGPSFQRLNWSTIITRHLNRLLKASRQYLEVRRQTFAQVTLHGIGPVVWHDPVAWCPEFIGLDDLLIPSATLVSLENLTMFALRRRYTPQRLNEMTSGPHVDPAWNVPLARALIKQAVQLKTRNPASDFNQPEKLAEAIRSNSGLYASDAVATIDVWDFFYLNDDNQWERRIIPDFTEGQPPDGWLYQPKGAYADSLDRFLHIQFADGNNVTPFKYHSVRSLGFLLYGVLHMQNRARCRFMDALWEHANWYFRASDPGDREMIRKIELHNMGVIPDNVRMVTPQERHTVNPELFVAAMSQNRQLVAETASSYTGDINDGTSKEATATEVMAKINAANAMVGAMLSMAYTYDEFQGREIARRFTLPHSTHPDVKDFQTACVREGVPPQFLNAALWKVQPVRVIGSGNKTLQLFAVDKLMGVRPLLPPNSQREVVRSYITANTDDPQMADALLPRDGRDDSDSVHEAQLAMGTLMLGLPVVVRPNLNPAEYAATILAQFKALIERCEQNGGTATLEQIMGFLNVEQHAWSMLELLAQDLAAKPIVRELSDLLGELMNYVKAYVQRYQEQAQAQGAHLPPEALAKIEASRVLAETQARLKEAAALQKLHHKELAFQADQRRKDQATKAQIAAQDIQTRAALIRDQAKADAE